MGADQGKLSLVRSNYHQESENAVNNLLSLTINYAYECFAIIMYFRRADVSLSGIALYYRVISTRLMGFVQKLMNYQTLRGGLVMLGDVKTPKFEMSATNTSVESFELVLERLKNFNDELCKAYSTAEKHNDAHLSNFIQHELAHFTNEMIYFITEKITKLRRLSSTGLGEYTFDRDLREWVNEHYMDLETGEGFSVLKHTPVKSNFDFSHSIDPRDLVQTVVDIAQRGIKEIMDSVGDDSEEN